MGYRLVIESILRERVVGLSVCEVRMVIKKKSWGFCVSDNCSSGYFKVGWKLLMAWLGIGFDVQAEILWYVL